jgi:hypothetical protein
MRYALDTDVLMAGLRSKTGASRRLLVQLSALRTERYFQEQMARADRADFLALLEKAGSDVAIEGDELPLGD